MSSVLLARCNNYREDLDQPCTGTLRYVWGQVEAACDTCGGFCGVAVADWRWVEQEQPQSISGGSGQQPPVTEPSPDDPQLAARHVDAVADTGHAYTVDRRRPWALSCLWCDFETDGHRTKADAMGAMSEHYATVTGVPTWRVAR